MSLEVWKPGTQCKPDKHMNVRNQLPGVKDCKVCFEPVVFKLIISATQNTFHVAPTLSILNHLLKNRIY